MTTRDGAPARLELVALPGMPMFAPGDDLAAAIVAAAGRADLVLGDDDVVVVAQKVVSKAEGRLVRLADVTPGPRALELAAASRKDPRIVELILAESTEVLRVRPGLIVVENRNGWIHANAGIDRSNVWADDGAECCLLLPVDPDASAVRIRDGIAAAIGVRPGVIVDDSLGRAWRLGVTGTALGVAGWPALLDRRGEKDLNGRTLEATVVGHADEIAAAASLLQGQGAEGRPVVVVRGLTRPAADGCGADLLRPRREDLFR